MQQTLDVGFLVLLTLLQSKCAVLLSLPHHWCRPNKRISNLTSHTTHDSCYSERCKLFLRVASRCEFNNKFQWCQFAYSQLVQMWFIFIWVPYMFSYTKFFILVTQLGTWKNLTIENFICSSVLCVNKSGVFFKIISRPSKAKYWIWLDQTTYYSVIIKYFGSTSFGSIRLAFILILKNKS